MKKIIEQFSRFFQLLDWLTKSAIKIARVNTQSKKYQYRKKRRQELRHSVMIFIKRLVAHDILSLYIFKHFLSAFAGALIFFVGLFLLVKLLEELDIFIQASDFFTAKEYLLYFVYVIPYYINYIYPLATLFSIVYALGQLHSKNEVIMMYITGSSVYYYCKFILLFIFGCSVFIMLFQGRLLYEPYQKHLLISKKLYRVQESNQKEVRRVKIALFGKDNKMFFIKEYSETKNEMRNVHIVFLDKNNVFTNLITAEKIFYDMDKQKWIGNNLYVWNFTNTNANHNNDVDNDINDDINDDINISESTNFQSYDMIELNLPEKPYFFQRDNQKLIDISAGEARRIAEKLTVIGGESEKWWTAYHFKLSLPYVAFFILFIGIPISTYSKKSTLIMSLFFVICIAFLYVVINEVGNSLGRTGLLPPLLGGWFGNVIFSIVGYVFYRQWTKL